jgi:hypothetical protein
MSFIRKAGPWILAAIVSSPHPARAAARDIIRPEWYSLAKDGAGQERYAWQSNPTFTDALIYLASSMIFDANAYACTNFTDPNTCFDFMSRCPKPKDINGALDTKGHALFMDNFNYFNYCRMNSEAARAEMTGNVPDAVKSATVYNAKFMPLAPSNGYLIDSYALLPKDLRRHTMGVIKQMWSGIKTCTEFKQRRNVISLREIEAPVGFYDCAYRDHEPGDPSGRQAKNEGVDFVPRDRGNQTESCLGRRTLYFDGPDCTGTAHVLVSDTESAFYRQRPQTAENSLITLTDAEFGSRSAEDKVALTTEILDRTIYYSYYDEPYRRAVRYNGTNVVPYLTNRNQIKSFYDDDNAGATPPASPLPAGRACRTATHGPTGNIPATGQFGYLDRLPGTVHDYSGFIYRQWRDNHPDDPSTLNAEQQTALVRNLIPKYRVFPGFPRQLHGKSCKTPGAAGAICAADNLPIGQVSLREWWSDDDYGDRSGTLRAAMCGPSEVLVSLGRNRKNYSYRPASSPNYDSTAGPYCLRYLISSEPRIATVNGSSALATGDTGVPLSEMSSLSRGVAGGAMVCETDPVLMQKLPAYQVGRFDPSQADGTRADDFNYTAKIDLTRAAILPIFEKRAASGTTYNNSSALLDEKSFRSEFAVADAVMPVPYRAVGLGNPNATVAMNYGRCVLLRTELDHPERAMGPLAIPLRNYITQIMELNLDEMPAGTPPNCP